MEADTLKARLSKALKARLPDSGRQSFVMDLVIDLDQSERTVRGWIAGATAPSGPSLLALFTHFGPGFEREVRACTPCEATKADAHARFAAFRATIAEALVKAEAPAKVTRLPVGVAK